MMTSIWSKKFFGFYLGLLLAFLPSAALAQKKSNTTVSRYEQLTGLNVNTEKDFWDLKYANTKNYVYGKTPAKFLADNYHYLPKAGTVLDMGMGEGRNAVFLAQKGFKVTGIDISPVAIKKAKLLAKEYGVRIDTIAASLSDYEIPKGQYDSIICYYYVDRSLISKMLGWLRPGGVLIYEAHTLNQKKVPGFENESNDYLLKPGELLKLFPGVTILKFEEPLHIGEYRSSIIIQK